MTATNGLAYSSDKKVLSDRDQDEMLVTESKKHVSLLGQLEIFAAKKFSAQILENVRDYYHLYFVTDE